MSARTLAILLLMLANLSSAPATETHPPGTGTVVLLHGMGRTRLSMQKLASCLEREGFQVVNLGYPSTKLPVAGCVEHLRDSLAAARIDTRLPVHFVSHSLGGIVIRAYSQTYPESNLGRVVMISPPNQGSELADCLMAGPLRHVYRLATGPSGQELGTSTTSLPHQLGPVNFPLGIITGDRTLNPVFSATFPGPNDGKVSVERARVQGMADFLVVPHSHSFIMRSARVAAEVTHFLKHGRFSSTAA